MKIVTVDEEIIPENQDCEINLVPSHVSPNLNKDNVVEKTADKKLAETNSAVSHSGNDFGQFKNGIQVSAMIHKNFGANKPSKTPRIANDNYCDHDDNDSSIDFVSDSPNFFSKTVITTSNFSSINDDSYFNKMTSTTIDPMTTTLIKPSDENDDKIDDPKTSKNFSKMTGANCPSIIDNDNDEKRQLCNDDQTVNAADDLKITCVKVIYFRISYKIKLNDRCQVEWFQKKANI